MLCYLLAYNNSSRRHAVVRRRCGYFHWNTRWSDTSPIKRTAWHGIRSSPTQCMSYPNDIVRPAIMEYEIDWNCILSPMAENKFISFGRYGHECLRLENWTNGLNTISATGVCISLDRAHRTHFPHTHRRGIFGIRHGHIECNCASANRTKITADCLVEGGDSL